MIWHGPTTSLAHQQELAPGFTGHGRNGTMSTLSLSNASLTGFAVRVAGVERVGGGGGGSSAIVGWTDR